MERIDPAAVGAVGVLPPEICAEVARKAAALIELDGLDREGSGEAVMLWRTDGSEAWLNTWWQPRDSGFHDHDGSCGGVHVLGRGGHRGVSPRGRSARGDPVRGR